MTGGGNFGPAQTQHIEQTGIADTAFLKKLFSEEIPASEENRQ